MRPRVCQLYFAMRLLLMSYFRVIGSSGILLCYDVSNPVSLERITTKVRIFRWTGLLSCNDEISTHLVELNDTEGFARYSSAIMRNEGRLANRVVSSSRFACGSHRGGRESGRRNWSRWELLLLVVQKQEKRSSSFTHSDQFASSLICFRLGGFRQDCASVGRVR